MCPDENMDHHEDRVDVVTVEAPVILVPTLFELSAEVTARHYSCVKLESQHILIDEGMIKRVAFWAFPQDENHVRAFARLNLKRDTEWGRGVRLVEERLVQEVNQVGFMLTAVIKRKYSDGSLKDESKVSLSFEKNKITASTCGMCSGIWCLHIIAAIVYRIRFPDKVQLFAPLTEMLCTFTRDQLQKLLQYAIASDPGAILGKICNYVDTIRDLNSNENVIAGAPDPTFGPDPESLSQMEAILLEMERKLRADFKSGYEGYPGFYNIAEKQASGLYRVYINRIFDLIEQGEVDAAARVLIIITNVTFDIMEEKHNPPNRIRWLFHDLEHIWNMFFISFSGPIIDVMVTTALSTNREASKIFPKKFVSKSNWAEFPSLEGTLKEDLVPPQAVKTAPFYCPLIAHRLPKTTPTLTDLLTSVVHPLYSTYYEPVSVMLLRFDALLMRNGAKFDLDAGRIGTVILRELMKFSNQYSILSLDKETEHMAWSASLPESEYSRDKLNGPKRVRTRRRKHRYAYTKKKPQKKVVDVKPVIIEPVHRQDLEKEQMAYCLLYTCWKMYSTLEFTHLDKSVQELLSFATLRALEQSRFRTVSQKYCDYTEHHWLEKLETSLVTSCSEHMSKEIAETYMTAMMKHGFTFYNNTPPLVLILTVCTCSGLENTQSLDLCVQTLCNSNDPMLKFSSVTPSNVDVLVEKFVGIFRFFLDKLYTGYSCRCNHLTQVLSHLEFIDDGKIMCRIMPVLKNIQFKQLDFMQLQSFTRLVVNFIRKSVDRIYGWDICYTLNETLLVYLNRLGHINELHFLKTALGSWGEIGKYLGLSKLKKLVETLRHQIWGIRAPFSDSSVPITMIVDFLQSGVQHGEESCELLSMFKQGGQNTLAIRVIRKNAQNYSHAALLRTAEMVYMNRSEDPMSLEVFSKEVYDLIKSALPKIGDEGVLVRSSDVLGSEYQYDLNPRLKWVFKCIKSNVLRETVNTEQYKDLIQVLGTSFVKQPKILIHFFQFIEDSSLHLEACRCLLGPGLIQAYKTQISSSLQRLSRSSYWNIFHIMEKAYHDCVKYAINGRISFAVDILIDLRKSNKGKKKFLKMMEENTLFGPLVSHLK